MPEPTIPRPPDEAQRLAALRRYAIVGTPAEEDFDFLAEMAALVCGTPFSFIVLVDEDKVWVKSAFGARAGVARPRDDDYCAWTILEAQGLHLPDLQADPRTAQISGTQENGLRLYSGFNLDTVDGHSIGTLCVIDTAARQLSGQQQRMLQRLARQVMSLIELRAAQHELRLSVERLDRLAREDELTGVLNRRALMQSLEAEAARQARYGGELAIVLLDLDHFKQVNDRFGHPVGDAVLRRVGTVLRECLRNVDVAGRYGGEEFLLVLPHTALPGAHVLAETLRARIAALDFSALLDRPVTASFGVAAVVPGPSGVQEAIVAADQALYAAKEAGRDQVMLASG